MATKEEIKTDLINEFGYHVEEVEELKYQDLKKKLKEEQDKVAKDNPIAKEKEEEKPKRKVKPTDVVTVMNTTTGKVIYTSRKTGAEWVFTEYGDTDEMEVSELVTMKNAHPRYLKEPWLLILDNDVVNYLGLSNIYDNVLDPDELDDFFKLPNSKMKHVLENAPRGMKQLIVGTARLKIENGTFDSMSKINLIEETLNVKLNK